MHCFDTDVVIAMLRGTAPGSAVRSFAALAPAEQATTAVTVAELVYGARKRGGDLLAQRVGNAIRQFAHVLPADERAGRVCGRLRADLEAQGMRLDASDLWIASICLARDATLVTGNVRHFERVPGLRIENWLAPG